MKPFSPPVVRALLRADMLNVARDPMLVMGLVLSIVPAILVSVFGPAAEAAARSAFGLVGMDRVLGILAVIMPGAMIGWATGFLLIEDRDETMFTAIAVTPLGRIGLVAWRLGLCTALVFTFSLAAALMALPDAGFPLCLAIALVATGYGPITALILLGFSTNKVEGLALTKLVNIAIFAPLLALLPAPWRYLAAPLPPFWIGELADLSGSAIRPVLALPLGLLTTALILALLIRRFH